MYRHKVENSRYERRQENLGLLSILPKLLELNFGFQSPGFRIPLPKDLLDLGSQKQKCPGNFGGEINKWND